LAKEKVMLFRALRIYTLPNMVDWSVNLCGIFGEKFRHIIYPLK
jgi:hypothetical protein